MTFNEVRNQYPQYDDLSDEQLVAALHSRYYNDMSFEDFSNRIGYQQTGRPTTGRWAELADNPLGNQEQWTGISESVDVYPQYSDISQYPEHIQAEMTQPFGSGDTVRAATQGATFGFGEEMEAGLNALWDLATGEGWTYSEWRDAFRDRMAAYSDENPWTSTGLEVAGSVPVALAAPAAKAWDGANKLRSVGRLGLEGAGYGGLYGVGTSKGETVSEIISDASKDAAIGAVASPLIGSGLSGLKALFTPTSNEVQAINQGFDITPSLAERYPNLGRFQSWLDTTSGGSIAASRELRKHQQDAVDALEALASGDMKASQDVGKSFINVKNTWQKNNENYFKDGFEDLRKNVDMDAKFQPVNTKNFLDAEREVFEGSEAIADIVEIPSIKRLRKALNDGDELSIDALWKLRQELGDSITTGKFGTDDVSQAKAKQLYGIVSLDLDEAIYRNSNLETSTFFTNLNEDYQLFQDMLDELRPIFAKSNREQHSPEKVTAELVKRFRDEPSTLDVLRLITIGERGGGSLSEAGTGVLRQTSLDRGSVSPDKALERYNISRSKSGTIDDVYPDPVSAVGTISATSPASSVGADPFNYERAIRLAERAKNTAERNAGDINLNQILASGGVPAASAAALGADLGGIATTALVANVAAYLTRRGLSSERVALAIEPLIKGIQDSSISPETLRLLSTMMTADSEAFSEF
ncbi:hypothetical protein AB4259_02665 [Vibrio amylolyticus]|uniref:hypothetical protein n=1 Tax=Vibrio amylolyticus TaxID=2847292 RepID=UPI00354B726E